MLDFVSHLFRSLSSITSVITLLETISHYLDQVKHVIILCFMIGVQALIILAFIVWATQKCWALAKTLLVVNGVKSGKSEGPPPVV